MQNFTSAIIHSSPDRLIPDSLPPQSNFLGWIDYQIFLAMRLRSRGRGAPLSRIYRALCNVHVRFVQEKLKYLAKTFNSYWDFLDPAKITRERR